MKLALLFGFWGESYTQLFLHFSLPSLLFPQNLPSITEEHDVVIKIATTQNCAALLRDNTLFQQLSNAHRVDITEFPDNHTSQAQAGEKSYSVWASLLNPLITSASGQDYDLFFMHPDSFYPDGFLPSVIAEAQKGKKLLYTAGIRVDTDKIKQTLYPDNHFSNQTLTPISGQHFDQMTLEHLHEFVLRQFWNSPQLSYWPSALLFQLNENVVVGKFADMHPIYVHHSVGNRAISHNVDVDYDFGIIEEIVRNEGFESVGTVPQKNGYFMSLTDKDDEWPKRLTLVGDDATASLENITFPQTDSDRWKHLTQWFKVYVPLKKIFCLNQYYYFSKNGKPPTITQAEQQELDTFFETLLYDSLMPEEAEASNVSMKLPQLEVSF